MSRQFFVYILASKKNGVLYTGVTNDLVRRVWEHKAKEDKTSFTARYDVDKLVWYDEGGDITAAIESEKRIKNRGRAWKIVLIEKNNPQWRDLSLDLPEFYDWDGE